jgi:hypothetical protein
MIRKRLGRIVVCLATALFAATLHAASSTSKPSLDALAGASPDQIKAFFASSDYTKLHRSDAEFIDDIYRGILHRAPDEKGREAWLSALKNNPNRAAARAHAVEQFLKSPEYSGAHAKAAAVDHRNQPDTTRNPANIVFNKTGVFVNDAHAFPADLYMAKLKLARVEWISLQIDNGGNIRTDNTAALDKGWANAWRAAGFKVGFWGCPRGVAKHNDQSAVDEAIPKTQADAKLAVELCAKYKADHYLADLEDPFQGYNATDPAPALNKVYVDAFMSAAKKAGLEKMPRALSSCGRIALDMKPWIEAGWDAMPQAYWNSYAVYQPSLCFDFYTQTGWPPERIHPTIATYTGEGENHPRTLPEYAKDLATRPITGISYYLPESYLRLDDTLYKQLAEMAGK